MEVLSNIGLLILAYFGYYLLTQAWGLFRQSQKARVLGFPWVLVPISQNGGFWMVFAYPMRPYLRRYLPKWIWDRIGITIQGWQHNMVFDPWDRFARPYGDPKTFTAASVDRTELSTWDYEITAEVLRRPRDFQQVDTANFLLSRFGYNLLSTDGEIWARHRKLIATVLNEKISKVVFNQAVTLSGGLLGEAFEDTPNSPSAETNNLFDMVKKLTITVLANAGMGGNEPWKETATKELKAGYKLTYMESVKAVIGNLVPAAVLPPWLTANYPTFLPAHETVHLIGHAVREFPRHTQDLIETEKKRQAGQTIEARSNILSMLLSASEGAGESENGNGVQQRKPTAVLSDDEIIGNLFIFSAAGFDSTSNTIAYALVELCRYPQYQDWIFEEIDEILPADLTEELDYTEIFPRAQRCLCVMLEVLRLHPPLVHLGKMTKNPTRIKTSKYDFEVPPGTLIYMNSVGLHLDPDVYRDVNRTKEDKDVYVDGELVQDEYIYRPTRWLGPPDAGSTQLKLFQPPRGSFIPWSMGPRVCPGMKMAQVEFVAALLVLFRSHRLEVVKIKVEDGKGGLRDETDEELATRLRLLVKNSTSKLTQEMDVYDITEKDETGKGLRRGLSMRLTRRK